MSDSDARMLAAIALRERAVHLQRYAGSRKSAGPQHAEHRAEARRQAVASTALADRLEREPPALLGARTPMGYMVVAAVPMFPGSGIPDYIVAAFRADAALPEFATWHASWDEKSWLFETGRYFTATDLTADAVREAGRLAMLSLAERCGAALCQACGGAIGDKCRRCA